MPLPKVTFACCESQIEVATRQNPDEFLTEWMGGMMENNRELLVVIMELCDRFGGDDSEKSKIMATVAVVLKCIEGQIGANELEEQFGGSDIGVGD